MTGTLTAGVIRATGLADRATGLRRRHQYLWRVAHGSAVRGRGRCARYRRPRDHDYDSELPAQPEPKSRTPRRDRKHMIETEMAKLGVRNVIWLEGDPCEPPTSGHADGYVLCAPMAWCWWRQLTIRRSSRRWGARTMLRSSKMRRGRRTQFKVMRVLGRDGVIGSVYSEYFARCYLNVYVANSAVIGAHFGDTTRRGGTGTRRGVSGARDYHVGRWITSPKVAVGFAA